MNNPMNPGWGQAPQFSQQYPNNQIAVERQDPRANQYANPQFSQPYGGQQVNYNPSYYMQAPDYRSVNQRNQPSQSQSLVKVLSEAEAQSYLVMPGNSVAMIDAAGRKLYIKSVSPDGNPSFERYALIPEREPAPEAFPENFPGGQNQPDFVTRKEYDELRGELDRVVEAMTRLTERMRDDGRGENE